MITCYLMGGLGNQLFQIFTTISYAMKNKIKFNFSNCEFTGGVGKTIKRDTYWKNLLYKLRPFLISNKDFPQLKTIKERDFTYNNLDLSPFLSDNICLYGYFQSYKYFVQFYNTIYRLLNIDKQKEKVIYLYNEYKKTNVEYCKTVSIHFRLGDYKKITDIHPIMPYEYYKNALQHIITNDSTISNILYFCEEEDIKEVDITVNKLKDDFYTIHFERMDNHLSDWEQMLLMSCCKNNVIANSSFSWWGAYLNSNLDKIICYPSVWFGTNVKHDTKDLFPNVWKKIDF